MCHPRIWRPEARPSIAAVAALLLALWPTISQAYSTGPPDAHTGAPGENNCTECHNSFPLNSGDGALTILGPEVFHPGVTYDITVVLSDPGQVRWGFECSPLTLGTCTISDPVNTQLSIFQGKSYVKHTLEGNHTGNTGPVSWTFRWTAPSQNPPTQVIFYAAGNAANSNGQTSGDYIYTASLTSLFEATAVEENPVPAAAALGAWPNPLRVGTLISFDLDEADEVSLVVFEPSGRLVAVLHHGRMDAGPQAVHWDARTVAGERAPAGVYLCRLQTSHMEQFHRLVVLE